MDPLSNKPVRLYKPPILHEMKATGVKYFSLSNKLSREIMIHLGYDFLHLLTQVNNSFYKLLNRSLENGPCIFGYQRNKMIDSEFLKRLYEEHEAFLNEHKAICHRGDIPLCSMIICCTEWPDIIDPRRLHLLSLVDPDSCNTFAFQIYSCGNITDFDHRSFEDPPFEDPSFKYSQYNPKHPLPFKYLQHNCYRIPYRELKWREPTFKDQNEI
jgi:hypothetical protein